MHHWGYVMEQLTHGAGHTVGTDNEQVQSAEIRRNRRRWSSLVGQNRGPVPPFGPSV